MKQRPEKCRLEGNLNPDLCDASVSVGLYQLSYQACWELVIIWVYDKPVDSGYNAF